MASASPGTQRLFLLILCSLFITVGLSIFIPSCLLPFRDYLTMREWKETPCTVLRAPFGDDEAHAPGVLYEYEFEGTRYESEELGLDGMFLPMRPLLELQPGAKTVCFVYPSNPNRAVLFRDIDPSFVLGATPLLFVFLPTLVLVLGWKNIGRAAEVPPVPQPFPTGPIEPSAVIESPHRSKGCAIVMICFALLFFGGMVTLLWFLESVPHLLLFGVPMALLCLVLLRQLFRTLLSLLNPVIALRITPARGKPGGTLDVRWDALGGLREPRTFLLELVVREERSARSERSSRTRTSPLATMEIARGGAKEFRRGSVRITLPDTMHSFRQGGVAIVWVLRLTAEIALAPDLEEEYPLEVGAA